MSHFGQIELLFTCTGKSKEDGIMNLDKIIALRNDRTVYRDGGKCLKVFGKNVSKAKVFTEAFNQAQAQCAGVVVPTISQIVQIDGKWAIIYDFVEGKSLAEEMKNSPEKVHEYLEKLVQLQIELHKPKETDLPELRDRLKKDIEKADLRRELKDELLRLSSALPEGDGIFHGCFSPDNIILGVDGNDYIIDWTHACQGSIYADAAGTYLTFILESESELAAQYLKIFGAKTHSDIKQVRRWMPVISAAKFAYANERERKLLAPWLEAIYFEE